MTRRLFTAAEANAALATVRPLAEEMVRLSRVLREVLQQREALAQAASGNGGGSGPQAASAQAGALQEEQLALARCVAELEALGVQVKDLESGLLDFPSERGGQEILLCWRVGEPDVAWWHPVAEGFAGRRPLDADA